MISGWRLHSSKYSANDPTGAFLNGGRWNPEGTEAIYACNHPALCAVEILANYAVVPTDFVLTEIYIPNGVGIETVEDADLPFDWNATLFRQYKPYPFSAEELADSVIEHGKVTVSGPKGRRVRVSCQDFGFIWHHSLRSAVLSVPSTVMSAVAAVARNFVLNPRHPDFAQIQFRDPIPFTFDPRLK